MRGGSRSTLFQKGTWSRYSHLGRKRLVDIFNQEGMGKIHIAFICLACESIRFFRLKFLVSPAEKTRNLSRKTQAIICRTSLNFARLERCKTQSLTETSRGSSAVSVVEKDQRRWSGNQLTVLWKKLADLTRCPPQTSTDLLVGVIASILFSFYWEMDHPG